MKLVRTKIFNKHIINYLADDKYIGQRIALEKYEPYLTKLMLSKISKGDVVMDIGANIGYYTILFSNKVGKKGKVISIEPDETNHKILQKNIKKNNLKNVVVVKKALGSENKKIYLYKSEENYGDHRAWGDKSNSTDTKREKISVECQKLDDLIKDLKEEKINFIKMDVQGFEGKVIEGGQKVIKENKPIIFFEYWPWAIKKSASDLQKMLMFLEKVYKKIFWIDEYIQIYTPVSKSFLIKKYKITNKNESGNLWVKNGIDFTDIIGQFKDFWIKKYIKRILGKEET